MVSVREASVEDAAELLEIYRPYVEHTDVSFEYVTPSVQEFAGRIAHTLQRYPYLVAQNEYNLCACIAYPYPDSEKFHERMGFQTVAHFHHSGFKSGHWVDMIWMEKALREHDGAPEPFIPYSHLD